MWWQSLYIKYSCLIICCGDCYSDGGYENVQKFVFDYRSVLQNFIKGKYDELIQIFDRQIQSKELGNIGSFFFIFLIFVKVIGV